MAMDREELGKRTDVCTLCGSCNSFCPVFDIELTEPHSPRGKINLIKEYLKGNIQEKKTIKDLISVCLICSYCRNSCSRGVDFREAFSGFFEIADHSDKDSIPD